MSSCLLSPVKTEKQVFENSMPEDDPTCNSDVIKENSVPEDFFKPRWVPNHAGARELAGLYTRGESHNRTYDWDILATYSGLKQEIIVKKERNSNHLYKCNNCPFTTDLPTVLSQHMLSHSTEKPYKCPICNKGYNQKASLQIHMLHHTGERPHKCLVCQRCYFQKGSMRRHILQHLGEDSKRCPLCSKDFDLRSEVEAHLIQHTKEDSFFCSLCQASFTSAVSLEEHNRIHH